MKGYRIVTRRELDNILKARSPFVNTNGFTHKYARNNLQKSKTKKCFWFFESLESALSAYYCLSCYSTVGIIEVEVPNSEIYERGKGNYVGSCFMEFEDNSHALKEFTTLKFCPNWLNTIHYVGEVFDPELEDFVWGIVA